MIVAFPGNLPGAFKAFGATAPPSIAPQKLACDASIEGPMNA
jgi:hypothetical protein